MSAATFTKALEPFRNAGNAGSERQRKNATAWISFVQEKIALKDAALS